MVYVDQIPPDMIDAVVRMRDLQIIDVMDMKRVCDVCQTQIPCDGSESTIGQCRHCDTQFDVCQKCTTTAPLDVCPDGYGCRFHVPTEYQ